jgi:hypothetical protein
VGSKTVEGEDLLVSHERDLRRVLDALKKWNLIADLKKCIFFVP